jgi:hypothetical protein
MRLHYEGNNCSLNLKSRFQLSSYEILCLLLAAWCEPISISAHLDLQHLLYLVPFILLFMAAKARPAVTLPDIFSHSSIIGLKWINF